MNPKIVRIILGLEFAEYGDIGRIFLSPIVRD